jgi:quercetin dioxygenase-like cupin family protein
MTTTNRKLSVDRPTREVTRYGIQISSSTGMARKSCTNAVAGHRMIRCTDIRPRPMTKPPASATAPATAAALSVLRKTGSITSFEPSVRRAPLMPLDPEEGRVWDFGAREAVGLRAVVVHGPPGDHAGTLTHEGEEVVCVLSGEYELHIGDRSWRLGPGDVAHYDPRGAHHLLAAAPRSSALIVVMHA